MPIAVSGSNIVFADGSSIASGFTGFKNKIINGAMVMDQRNAGSSFTTTTANLYSLDRWRTTASLNNKYSVQRSTTAPTGFVSSLLVTSLTSTSLDSGDYFGINQFVEGNNTTDLSWGTANAKTVTLSFWVRSSLTGAFGGAIRTGDGSNYSYPFTYTINSANTWEQKSIVIPGPTAGTWGTGTAVGLDVWFSIGSGATYTGTANAWAASNLINSTGSTNLLATNGATWYVTGVQLEVGLSATSFEYLNYGNELNLCLRYYHFIGGDTAYQSVNNVVWYTSGDAVGAFRHPVPMRTTPTIAKSGSWATLGGGGSVGQTVSADQNGPKTTQLGFSSGSGGSSGQASVLRVSDDLNFRLTFSAEL
jgi:hypothetical protein